MTKEQEALKLALEALTYIHAETSTEEDVLIDEAITAIEEALAQPAQEPVGYVYSEAGLKSAAIQRDLPNGTPLYAAPQQRPWVGLTAEEIHDTEGYKETREMYRFAHAIEAKLKDKNLIAAGSQAFYGFPTEPVSTPNAGGKCVTAGETAPTRPNGMLTVEEMIRAMPKDTPLGFMPTQATHTINSTKTVAVATDTFWLPIDKDTPRSVKLQLLSIGGVAQYGVLQADTTFYTHWCPVPKKAKP